MKKILSLIVIYFLLTSISWGSNFGSSLDGESASITFSHTSDLDSVHAWFGYDGDGSGADSANLYYWKKLLPCFGNDKIAMADNVALDSIGTHVLKIVYWPPDGSDSIATGIWLHQGGASDVNVVQISGDATAADNAEYFFDGTGIAQDLDIKIRSLEIDSDVGDAVALSSSAAAYVGCSIWGKYAGLFLGTTATVGDHYGMYIQPSSSGTPYDIYLARSGTIHGTIDRCTYVDSTDTVITEPNVVNSKITGMDATVYDSIAHEVYDTMLTHAADFKATGFATSADGDSVTNAIADANKENFKYGGGADSVRAFLAEHDSTLLEQAAATGGSGGELCSILTKDSGGQAVSGLTWTVRDSAGNVLGIADTDASGWATFNIDLHDSVHAYPKERAGISLAYYYAEPVPSGGFCDTITATIWNYTVAGGGMCNLHINTRDLKRRLTGYGRWKMTVEYSEPGGYTDTTGGFLQWGGMEETAFKDSGLLQISVPQTYRALLYDSVTDTYTDSGLVNIRIYREDNLIREFFNVNVPRDSTQYDVLQLMMR